MKQYYILFLLVSLAAEGICFYVLRDGDVTRFIAKSPTHRLQRRQLGTDEADSKAGELPGDKSEEGGEDIVIILPKEGGKVIVPEGELRGNAIPDDELPRSKRSTHKLQRRDLGTADAYSEAGALPGDNSKEGGEDIIIILPKEGGEVIVPEGELRGNAVPDDELPVTKRSIHKFQRRQLGTADADSEAGELPGDNSKEGGEDIIILLPEKGGEVIVPEGNLRGNAVPDDELPVTKRSTRKFQRRQLGIAEEDSETRELPGDNSEEEGQLTSETLLPVEGEEFIVPEDEFQGYWVGELGDYVVPEDELQHYVVPEDELQHYVVREEELRDYVEPAMAELGSGEEE